MENKTKSLYSYDYVENTMLKPIEFLSSEDLAEKQDVLESGKNIKTINSQSILGEGDLEITNGAEGIEDAPSDSKKYVRSNGAWVEETTVDTSSFATKSELAGKADVTALEGKVDDAEIADMLTKTEAGTTYATKAELEGKVDDAEIADMLTKTEAGSTYATKVELEGKVDDGDITDMLTKTEAGSTYATKVELEGKLSTETYNSDKETFALKTALEALQQQLTTLEGRVDALEG